ncbi:DUF1516 family protein [Fructilactobacillus fructivorans]|uniref:DUF1516 family protein n=1 Tax=Fructilactobacillus fructivorans TaxID=1614 RepID=A0A0C1LYV9_9LACO|nr:DUF1516 family protein [Fructilactobacillus fructivorans]KID42080.1 hypothetical protein LfDm3_0485 [Fructilactobacillus fructivorans]KRK58521.1 hypothetical protein FC73_GL000076 [Fructilactobacillus fructivorans]KRN13366.1 hypothetical protein IV37_GL000082 [Fructilactobacillus fructivorans]KRN40075.1 hypothetical protein IV51_GL000256 [Fructilactobacillus fructivorans]KRN42502.1 hypothetical protein IV48_GL000150 [Fructilactobacillus fructivorans]
MLIYIITFLWILLLISLTIGITRKQDKQIIKGVIYTRAFYILLLIAEVIFTINHFNEHRYLVFLSFVMTIVAISFIDICYQRKIQGNLKTYIILLTLISILASVGLLFFIQ